MAKGKTSSTTSTTSSGLTKQRKIGRALCRLRMKAARWDRYTAEIEAGTRSGKVGRWNTDGLLKQIELLENHLLGQE